MQLWPAIEASTRCAAVRWLLFRPSPRCCREQRRWASAELRWFSDILGETRNLDVFASELLRPARAALTPASDFEPLGLAIARRRRAAHKDVVKAITSTRYTETMLALLRWFDGGDWRPAGSGDALDRPIEDIAPLLLDRCRKKAEKRSKGFAGQSARQRHRLRIALKNCATPLNCWRLNPGETGISSSGSSACKRSRRYQRCRVGRHRCVAGASWIAATSATPDGAILAWHKRRLGHSDTGWAISDTQADRFWLAGRDAASPRWRRRIDPCASNAQVELTCGGVPSRRNRRALGDDAGDRRAFPAGGALSIWSAAFDAAVRR